jgi:hypothetical protein
MTTSKILTTTVAALTVVGAGLVYAQTTAPSGAGPMTQDPATQAQPTPPNTTTPPATTTTPAMPSQESTQRSTVPMTTPQADRN